MKKTKRQHPMPIMLGTNPEIELEIEGLAILPAPNIYTDKEVQLLVEAETPFGTIMLPSGHKTKTAEQCLKPPHPIPLQKYQEALAFMDWTFVQFGAEGLIYGFMNTDGEWLFEPPTQTTQGMTVAASNSDLELQMQEKGYTLRFTLHHHCKMTAGQSGTDHNSEHSQPTALHITVGDMERDNYSIHARLVLRAATTTQSIITENDLPAFFLIPDNQIYLPPRIIKELLKAKTTIDFPEQWKSKITKETLQVVISPGKHYHAPNYTPSQKHFTQSHGYKTNQTIISNGGQRTEDTTEQEIIRSPPFTLPDTTVAPKLTALINRIDCLHPQIAYQYIGELIELAGNVKPYVLTQIQRILTYDIFAVFPPIPAKISTEFKPAWNFHRMHQAIFDKQKMIFIEGQNGQVHLKVHEDTLKAAKKFLLASLTDLSSQMPATFEIKTVSSNWHHRIEKDIAEGEILANHFMSTRSTQSHTQW